MQPLAPHEIKELLALLQTALDLPDDERRAWLATLDDSKSHLRTTVVGLLQKQAQHETDEFLDALSRHTRTGGEREVSIAPAPYSGGVVGPYRLLSLIGEGGMSSVWLAERDDGVLKRKVALKLPHWWALSKLTDRAVLERDILATLEHPNIARLYDAGITTDGRPYLALEYIEGQSIDVYCRDHAADLRTRVQLIAQIARAVAYAHSRLIVHRDLKPSNILIDAQGQVHLLDFGIAKLIEEGGAANKALTQVGTLLLTPAYASPEQILGSPVTTESDVYSLGMVAYEVLTGERPYDFTSAATTEREILTAEIRAPSTIARGNTEARALRGDLDTILLKALKRDANERYTTAAAFADDLERYLRGDPVLAQPDSAGYRLRKFAARNRLAVGATLAVVLALAAGLFVSIWQLRVARAEKRHAEEVKEFVASIFRSADPFFTGNRQMTAAQLLTLAKDRIDREMASQPQNAAELLLIVGESQANLEQLDDARKTLEKALANAQDTLPADSLQVATGRAQLANVRTQQDDYDEGERQLALALPILRAHKNEPEGAKALANALATSGYIASERGNAKQAVAIMHEAADVTRATLGENDSETILAQRELAQELLMQGEVNEALKVSRAAYETAKANFGSGGRDNLLVETEDVYGRALTDAGELEQGIAHLMSAVNGAERILGPDAESVSIKLTWLARAQLKLGDLNGAIESLRRSVKVSAEDLNRARASASLGLALTTARQLDEAIPLLKTSIDDLRRLDTTGGAWIGNAMSTYGNALIFADRTKEAEQTLNQAIADKVTGPAMPDSYNGLGFIALGRKDTAAGKRSFEKALELTAQAPPTRVTVNALLGLGSAQLEAGELAEADATLAKAEATQASLVARATPVLMDIEVARGRVALAQGKRAEAAALFAKADEYWRSVAPTSRWAREAAEWKARAK